MNCQHLKLQKLSHDKRGYRARRGYEKMRCIGCSSIVYQWKGEKEKREVKE